MISAISAGIGHGFNQIVAGIGKGFALGRICCYGKQFVGRARTRWDSSRPTASARRKRDCRDNWWSRCGAIRSWPRRHRTSLFPPPRRAVSTARPTAFRPAPRPAATDNRPTCSWPCAARPRRRLRCARELSISMNRLRVPDWQAGYEILRFQPQLLVDVIAANRYTGSPLTFSIISAGSRKVSR